MPPPLGILRGGKSRPAPGSHTPAAPLLLNRLGNGKIGGTWYVPSSIPNRAVEEQTRIQRHSLWWRAGRPRPAWTGETSVTPSKVLAAKLTGVADLVSLTACPNSPRSKPLREASTHA